MGWRYIKKYIIRRMLSLIPILLGITIISFFLMQLSSGDYVDVLYDNIGLGASETTKDALRQKLDLDKPVYIQYINWLKGVLNGDMGTSYSTGKPVFDEFIQKLPATLSLTASSMAVTLLLSVPLGIISAVKQNRIIDYLIRALSFVGNSIPNFFLALILLYFFSVKLGLVSVINSGIILPTVTLSTAMTAKYIRQVRTAVLEELGKDYVKGARVRGVKESTIMYRTIIKSAMLTLIAYMSLSLGSLLGGIAIVESIFSWDGIGKMAVDAITMRDYPVIQAYVMWMAAIYVVINLFSDIVQHYLDPRIRLRDKVV